MTALEYGVIAYEPIGVTPSDDPAHFDGWYANEVDADAIFQLFVKDYPECLVHLVVRKRSEWRAC